MANKQLKMVQLKIILNSVLEADKIPYRLIDTDVKAYNKDGTEYDVVIELSVITKFIEKLYENYNLFEGDEVSIKFNILTDDGIDVHFSTSAQKIKPPVEPEPVEIQDDNWKLEVAMEIMEKNDPIKSKDVTEFLTKISNDPKKIKEYDYLMKKIKRKPRRFYLVL